jgi:hypothetical protein
MANENNMPTASDEPSAATPRRWFYSAAVILMLVGVAAVFMQKARESAVGMTAAKRAAAGLHATEESREEVEHIIREAGLWAMASFTAVFLAMLSWAAALSRFEKRQGTWAILVSLLALYVGLQLIMV